MKPIKNPTLLAATLIALAPASAVRAEDPKPDFGLEPHAHGAAKTAAPPEPSIKIEIDGQKLEINPNQIEAMVGEVLKNLSSDDGKAAREMLSNLLGVEVGEPAEMLLNLMKQLPNVAGEGSASFELGGLPGINFEAKAYVIGPDGEKREVAINADEIRRNWHSRVDGDGHVAVDSAPDADVEMPPYFIGVTVEAAPESLRGHLGLPDDAGLVVEDVFDGSPGAGAGLRRHDVIVKANGQFVGSQEALVKAVQEAGENALKLEIARGGKPEEIAVKPAKRPLPSSTVSGLFVPKVEEDEADEEDDQEDDLEGLRQEVRSTHELLEKILERLEKLERGE